jgi:hypothetical protein
MRDLRNPGSIVFKAALFLFLALLSSAVLLLNELTARRAILLAIAIWSSCRFYYFAFYALQHYVDPGYRFSGVFSLISHLRKHPKGRSSAQVNSR